MHCLTSLAWVLGSGILITGQVQRWSDSNPDIPLWNWNNNPHFQQLSSRSCDLRNCICNQKYIPFCGTDGRTYFNKCQFNCAQQCDRRLRMKFEGVCAIPYYPNSVGLGSGNYYPNNHNRAPVPRPSQVITKPLVVVGNVGQDNTKGQYDHPNPARFPMSLVEQDTRPPNLQRWPTDTPITQRPTLQWPRDPVPITSDTIDVANHPNYNIDWRK